MFIFIPNSVCQEGKLWGNVIDGVREKGIRDWEKWALPTPSPHGIMVSNHGGQHLPQYVFWKGKFQELYLPYLLGGIISNFCVFDRWIKASLFFILKNSSNSPRITFYFFLRRLTKYLKYSLHISSTLLNFYHSLLYILLFGIPF